MNKQQMEPERLAAMLDGKKRFFTGTPCPNGHIAEKLVSNGRCVLCKKEDIKRNRDKNRHHRNYVLKGISAEALEQKFRRLPSDAIPGARVFMMAKEVSAEALEQKMRRLPRDTISGARVFMMAKEVKGK